MDPIIFRGIERLLIIIGGIFFGYLGYRLFVKGLTAGEGTLKYESRFMKVLFSGTGPGLFFMAFGAIVLMVAIAKGGATATTIKETTTSPGTSTGQPSGHKTAISTTTEQVKTVKMRSPPPHTGQRAIDGKP